MGITPADLLDVRPAAPTFGEYIPVVRDRVTSASTLKTYNTHWKRLEREWGTRRLDEPTTGDITAMRDAARQDAKQDRNARDGRGAAEAMISALRFLYKHAENDGFIRPGDNPAKRVAKPRRVASTRRGLPLGQIAEITHAAAATGNDPDLDTLLLRLHTETACRRGGALALRPEDLDPDQCLIFLREKGKTARWQPVSPTLMTHLLHHAHTRGAQPGEQLLRYRRGKPITRRRYDGLWTRIGLELPWVEKQQITTHWLRHTTITWVERNFGFAVARAYAGHAESKSDGSTVIYTRAGLEEVALALATLTGEPHPLAAAAA
ncbi:site-specific integrase [Nocardia terpenica]|nr:site-specific integrase [Nocardia terpenica]MBF6107237.1 site-specific integrase [Nocardia terpenica]MBF6114994.1 site-specific integrase [Nocardia terpenica]MBF6122100.1 site-specific integrase [Nocardia terpenica]MBF6154483.1 site-specific integrase [Nocardia terpenica]